MSNAQTTTIGAALAALRQAEADKQAAEAEMQRTARVADQVARDHAADLLHELDIHIGDTVVMDDLGLHEPRAFRALLADAQAFLWQGDDIPEMTQRIGITLHVRPLLPKSGRPAARAHVRNLWLPPLPRGSRIAKAEEQGHDEK